MTNSTSMPSNRIINIIGVLILFITSIPLIVLIIASFGNSQYYGTSTHFSLKWYSKMLYNTNLLEAVGTSCYIGLITASISLVLGLLGGIALYREKGRNIMIGLLVVGLMIPEVIAGLASLDAVIKLEQLFGITLRGPIAVAFIQAVFAMPYTIFTIYNSLILLDRNVIYVSLALGSGGIWSMCMVALPQIKKGMVCAWLLAFMLSVDDLMIATFVGIDIQTLTMVLFSSLKRGIPPDLNALYAISTGMVAIAIASYFIWNNNKSPN